MKKVTLAALALTAGGSAMASSHREAPMISKDPAADITDVYVFKSPTQADHYVFVMNVSPAYNAYAGPNWYGFDDEVLYEMHIDNNGDAVEDVTYQFSFKTADYRAQKGLIVANFPTISWDAANNKYAGGLEGVLGADGRPALAQTYTVTKVAGKRREGTRTEVVAGVPVAPPRIGPQTTDGGLTTNGLAGNRKTIAQAYTAYRDLANNSIKAVAGTGKVFAGPRNDPFFVDLGAVFDRVSVRIPTDLPGPPVGTLTGTPRDALKGSNVLSIVLEVPNSEVFAANSNHLGFWATTSRPQAKVLKQNGQAPVTGGGYVQVSRLGNPLVNEVVIKMGDKDKFNATEPSQDAANFEATVNYVTKPQLAFVLNALYADGNGLNNGAGITADDFVTKIKEDGRTDLVDVFVAGIDGVSRFPGSTSTGDMIRVNKALDLGGNPVEGWPLNGRKLGDDVVATALQFLANCKVLTQFGNFDISTLWAGLHDVAMPAGNAVTPANCLLDDFVPSGEHTMGNAVTAGNGAIADFPYIDLPHSSFYDYDTTYP